MRTGPEARGKGQGFPKERTLSKISGLRRRAGASQVQRVQIGEWWADATTNELGRGSDTVRIEPKAMEVLMVLAGRAGKGVTREELLAAVWPGVVVGDEVLTAHIIKLRQE